MYKSYSLLEIKKNNAEFITPKEIIDIINNDINGTWKEYSVLDVCGGSGNIVYHIDCKEKHNIEINKDAAKISIENGIETINWDFLHWKVMPNNNLNCIDCIVSNPPYSIKYDNKYSETYDEFLPNFKKNGVLDKAFVIKSIAHLRYEGYFILFPGLLYRNNEKDFRKYLIDNQLLEKIFYISPNKFKDTSINVVILKINKKTKHDVIKLYQNETFIKEISINELDNDYSLNESKFIEQSDPNDFKNFDIEKSINELKEIHKKNNENFNEWIKLIETINKK